MSALVNPARAAARHFTPLKGKEFQPFPRGGKEK
jgi:hypothetical protein